MILSFLLLILILLSFIPLGIIRIIIWIRRQRDSQGGAPVDPEEANKEAQMRVLRRFVCSSDLNGDVVLMSNNLKC